MNSNTKPMSVFFSENLRAPLSNVQWSWGAENQDSVFLRIWDEEVKNKHGLVYLNNGDKRLGQAERYRHIQSIKRGKPGYVVVILSGHESSNGTWRIDTYKECVYQIVDITTDEQGNIYAKIDFDTPIYPPYIRTELDPYLLQAAVHHIPRSAELLKRATEKFGWRATRYNSDIGIIDLISQNGKQHASLNVSTSQWIRH
ncbi:hypothetical protein [Shewanella maritima]|uniref:hypothetical protein n=1 Tax=Shewanella maritima TaxID=2520507 RepID=UPI003735202B